jgi:hypothetical protein
MTGVFLDYWDLHGGVEQQGFPIAEVLSEVSDLDGVPYQVQYFERAVFEYHPENRGTAYEVLLAQLGTYQYRQKYPNGAPNQRPNGENPRYFAETGHTLGGEFRLYWEQHGGLEQQGYPLSDEFTEISPLDGKPCTVQYFERAVMEFHPENSNPYRVLLSQLGTLRQRARYPVPPGVSPTPDPAAARYLGGIFGDSSGSADFAVGGGAVYWFDSRYPYEASTLVRYDLATQQRLQVVQPTDRVHRDTVVTDGRTVAWREVPLAQASPVAFVRGYNVRTGEQYAPVPYDYLPGGFAVDDDVLYLIQSGLSAQEIHAHNWTTGQDTLVALIEPGTMPTRLVAGHGYVVWAEGVGDQYIIRLAFLGHPEAERSLGGSFGHASDYVIAGDRVIWAETPSWTSSTTDIRMFTLSTGATTTLARETGRVDSLSAEGDRIAWRRASPNDPTLCLSVVVLDLRAGALQTGLLLSYGGRQVALAGPGALVYTRAGEPLQLYLQSLR